MQHRCQSVAKKAVEWRKLLLLHALWEADSTCYFCKDRRAYGALSKLCLSTKASALATHTLRTPVIDAAD